MANTARLAATKKQLAEKYYKMSQAAKSLTRRLKYLGKFERYSRQAQNLSS